MNDHHFSIALHGGAGTIERGSMTEEMESAYLAGLKNALEAGRKLLAGGASALDAVVAAVTELENNPLFNAGRGAVFNHAGRHELDAAVMEGRDLRAGAVCGVQNIRNPVLLAHAVMERTPHVLLCGEGAQAFAREAGIETAPDEYFFNELRHQQWQEMKDSDRTALDHSDPGRKMGTVGAVARDVSGNLAAATSTGGMTNKRVGRIGDTPVIGSGTYANNLTCAISCTGHGELFLRSVVAYDISCLMEYKGMTLGQACDLVVNDKLVKIGGEGGLVAVDAAGHIAMPFNSSGMYRASCDVQNNIVTAIYR